ncbi:hypothetical protein GF325_00030 [Candidatus Bathyarchaeota archaeon]|nr:hypothetical protein [Candidatus Bathyarchaeota archaeon]
MADVAPVRVAFIGTGRISTLHHLYYANHDDAEVVAICDKSNKLAKKRASEWHLRDENVYTDIQEMLKREDIDAVEVLTPHSQHRKHVELACEAGLHVSVQKVPCLSLSDFDAMVHAARKANVKFKVFENFQFHPPYQRALEIINGDEIGDPMAVNIRMWSTVKALSNWDVSLKTWRWRITEHENFKMPTLFDDGYHKHNMIHLLLGKDIHSVQAWKKGFRLYKLLKIDVPAVISYKTKGVEYGTWNVSMAQKLPIHSDFYGCDEAVEIQCERGIIWVNGCTGKMFAHPACGIGNPGVYWINQEGDWASECSMPTNWKHSFMNCTRDFIESIREDREPYRSGESARHVLQIDLAMVASLRSGFSDFQVSRIKDGLPDDLSMEVPSIPENNTRGE